MRKNIFDLRKWLGIDSPPDSSDGRGSSAGCGGGGGGCSCNAPGTSSPQDMGPDHPDVADLPPAAQHAGSWLDKSLNRRQALGAMVGAGVATATAAHATVNLGSSEDTVSLKRLEWEEYFKKNYRVMTQEERDETVQRLEKIAEKKRGQKPSISSTPARPETLWGYAFNVSKCQGYRDCISACVEENNQDRDTNMQYIRIFEMENGNLNLKEGTADYSHEVPAAGHFYLGTQCFQCENPPCVKVCPVGATWKEEDGIVVVDYDWCIGCRYCQAACPYWARRFNWSEPVIPQEEVNQKQHYLSNRPRTKGVMEKCTFCLQRTREGGQPACVEACPTGARIFGNLLDPDSEIRWILANKKVFRLKEELGAEPKFWYYMD